MNQWLAFLTALSTLIFGERDPEKIKERKRIDLCNRYNNLQVKRRQLEIAQAEEKNNEKRKRLAVELALTNSDIAGVREALRSLGYYI